MSTNNPDATDRSKSDVKKDVQDSEDITKDRDQDSFDFDKLCQLTTTENALAMHMLPPKIKRRLKALKKLQLQYTHLEAKFYEEVHKLECVYNKMYAKLYEKREEIVNGKYEPTDDECDFIDTIPSADLPKDFVEKVNLSGLNKMDPNSPGIPQFWLTIFKNVAMLNDMVQPHDEAILNHLQDIKVIFLEKDPMGFILEFYFSENEYFTNKVLTKEYIMKCVPDEIDPFSFEGPEIYKCKGSVINWKTGKDITVKVVKKKQKHKSKGAVRTVTKLIKNDTFFNFFSPPVENDPDEVDLDDETQALLTSDFEIGHYIRERIIPNAVLYYTGEALDDDDDYEDDDEDEDDSEELSSESDHDSEVYQRPDGKTNASGQNLPPDCKQQ